LVLASGYFLSESAFAVGDVPLLALEVVLDAEWDVVLG
jgi:hypothetical protein